MQMKLSQAKYPLL